MFVLPLSFVFVLPFVFVFFFPLVFSKRLRYGISVSCSPGTPNTWRINLLKPRSVRQDGRPPEIVRVERPEAFAGAVADAVRDEVAAVESGNVAVICPASRTDECSAALAAAGIEHGVAIERGLNHQVTVVPVGIVKGLELDATVVVDPAGILDEEAQGMRALYVALTRATKLLTIVHEGELPDVLLPAGDAEPAPVG